MDNYIKIEFPSISCNEAFARAAAGAFAARLDITVDELADIKTAVRGGDKRNRSRIFGRMRNG